VKHEIRVNHTKATTGGKKAKKAKKGEEVAEAPSKANAVLFVGVSFPEYQRKVLEILKSFEFKDGALQGDYVAAIREAITDKKECGLAMKFAPFVLNEAKKVGPEAAFALLMPFEEFEVMEQSKDFLFENMPTIQNIVLIKVSDEGAAAIPEGANSIAAAVPGKPQAHFY
jgi:hypothetical protein